MSGSEQGLWRPRRNRANGAEGDLGPQEGRDCQQVPQAMAGGSGGDPRLITAATLVTPLASPG